MHPFAVPGKKGLEAALVDIGSPGGILDARDALDRGPVDLIGDLSLSAHNPNNPTHTAGTTFFGQFMDHDMTFDLASPLGKPSTPQDYRNGRTPSFDLDSVYGAVPWGLLQLYDPHDRAKLKVESGGLFEDVLSMPDGTAIVADPAQRRARDHQRAAGGLPALRQQRRRSAASRRHARRGGDVSPGSAAHDLALPVADPERVPAALRWAADGGHDPTAWPALLPAPQGRGVHSGRVPGSRVPLRSLDGGGLPTGRTSPGTTGKPFFALTFDVSKKRPRPRRSPWRLSGALALHRLADVLRLRRRPGEAEQAHRHAPSRHRSFTSRSARSRPTPAPPRFRCGRCFGN